MAIHHFQAKLIQRSEGHSAVAAAAYRSRSAILETAKGVTHDYSKAYGKAGQDLLFAGIYLPKTAPSWAGDRAELWNHVEAAEKKVNSQLARDFDIALPHELTLEQNRYLLEDFVKKNFTRKGYAADVCIHEAHDDGDARNIHAHIMVTMRQFDGEGFARTKDEHDRALNRIGQLEEWRADWSAHLAHHLERWGHTLEAQRMAVGHMTLPEQRAAAVERGDATWADQLDRPEPQHLGKAAAAMERRGIKTDLGDEMRARQPAPEVAREIPTAEPAKAAEVAHIPEPQPARVIQPEAPTPKHVQAEKIRIEREISQAIIGHAWETAEGDAVQFAINLGEAGLSLARDDKGKFVAVDGKGYALFFTDRVLNGDSAREAQTTLATALSGDVLAVPTVAEIREDLKQERLAAWKEEQAAQRRQIYVTKQRIALEHNPTAHAINSAFFDTETNYAFLQELEAWGVLLCRVSAAEAAKMKQARDDARENGGRIPPAYEAGTLLAMDDKGQAYRLDATTIYTDDATIKERFAGYDPGMSHTDARDVIRAANREAWQERIRAEYAEQQRERHANNETVARINTAYQQTPTPADFAAELIEQRIMLARVSAEDAAAIATRREVLQSVHAPRLPTQYDVGELVAVNDRGHVYRIDATTINDDEAQILARFGKFTDKQLSLGAVSGIQAVRRAAEQEAHRLEGVEKASERLADFETVRRIGKAWFESDTGPSFAQALLADDILVLRVTEDEALETHARRASHQSLGYVPPLEFAAGDYVAIDKRGYVFALDRTTIFDEEHSIKARLAELDPDAGLMLTLSQGKDVMRYWREHDGAERDYSYTIEPPGVAGRAFGLVSSGVGSVMRGGEIILGKLLDVLDYLFGGAPTTPQQEQQTMSHNRTDHESARQYLRRASRETAASDANTRSLVQTHGADADLLADIRRQMEEHTRNRNRDR